MSATIVSPAPALPVSEAVAALAWIAYLVCEVNDRLDQVDDLLSAAPCAGTRIACAKVVMAKRSLESVASLAEDVIAEAASR